MYIPDKFNQRDLDAILSIVNNYPFATIISSLQGEINVSQAPLLARNDSDRINFAGHLARANRHWHVLEQIGKATLLFYGPDSYISPTWYPDPKEVPTWNYVTIQCKTNVKCVHDREWLLNQLQQLVETHDPKWGFDKNLSYIKQFLPAIVGLEFSVVDVEAKFKLSQHRSLAERHAVIEQLKKEPPNPPLALAELMQTTLKKVES